MEHIIFTKVEMPARGRRKRPGFSRGIKQEHEKHGNELIFQINNQTQESLKLADELKFSPYLVVKVELEKDAALSEAHINKLELMGLKVIDVENKEIMVLFADDYQLQEFKNALNNYKNGVIAVKKIENEDLFAVIKNVSRWGKVDRRGQDIDQLLSEDYIDCYLWVFDSREETIQKAEEFINEAKQHCMKYCDKYISQSVAIVRLKIEKSQLDYFLEHPLLYRIDRMPCYQMKITERQQITNVSLNDIKYTNEYLTEDSSSICIIDSGILSGHPLLKECIGDAKSFYITNDYTVNENDIDGHGTMVAGISEYGLIDVQGFFAPKIKLFNAKIHDGCYIGDFQLCINELLNENFEINSEIEELIYSFYRREIDIEELMKKGNVTKRVLEFKNIINKYVNIYEKLRPNQMREIVEYFYNNYGCRIYNLSQGDLFAPYDDGKPRAWTCVLDELQREYNVLFVVSTGNYSYAMQDKDMEEVLKDYPLYFYTTHSTRIIDPAASASSLTIGGISKSGVAFETRKEQINILPISKQNQISSITRVGPGISKAIKPDLVAYSGDEGLNTSYRNITKNIGFQILSFSNKIQEGLFAYDYGTSFAAPYVSHVAALIIEKYKNCTNNLVRAILVSSAKVPKEVEKQISEIVTQNEKIKDINKNYKQNIKGIENFNKQKIRHYSIGYGLPDEVIAVDSFENRVVLCADMFGENAIQVDTTHIFEIPIPDVFAKTQGKKRIIISLAFNPEVRKTRLDYIGTSMSFELIRGKNLQEIYEVCASQAGKEEKEERFKSPFVCKTENSGKTLREFGTLQKGEFEFSRSDYGDYYYVVVDCKRNWSSEAQDYALVVTYEIDKDVQLYNIIRDRIRSRGRGRI